MAEGERQKNLKAAGIYLIVILALLRFLIYPLTTAVEEQKRVINAQQDHYRLKVRLLNQQQNRNSDVSFVKKADLIPYLYEKPQGILQIQLEVVEKLRGLAREKGAELIRFEIHETLRGKTLNEAPITVAFSGPPQALMNILRTVETNRKLLSIKNMEISKGRRDYELSLTLSAYRLET